VFCIKTLKFVIFETRQIKVFCIKTLKFVIFGTRQIKVFCIKKNKSLFKKIKNLYSDIQS